MTGLIDLWHNMSMSNHQFSTSQPFTSPSGEHYLIIVGDNGVAHYASNPGGMLTGNEHPRFTFRNIFTVCGIERLNEDISGDGFYSIEDEERYADNWANEGETRSICKRCQSIARSSK